LPIIHPFEHAAVAFVVVVFVVAISAAVAVAVDETDIKQCDMRFSNVVQMNATQRVVHNFYNQTDSCLSLCVYIYIVD